MANQSELKIKLTLLADGLKQALGDAKQGVENFKKAVSGSNKSDFTDALKDKVKQADEELKKTKLSLERLKSSLAGKSGPLADSITQEIGKAEAKIRQTEAELDKLKAKLSSTANNALANNAKAGLNEVGNAATGLRGKLENTFNNIGSMVAGAFAIGAIVSFTKSLVDTVQRMQDLRTRLSGLTTSTQDYAASEAYLVDLSQRHHKSVEGLTDSYAAFLTLERSGIITRQQSIQLTEGFSNVASRTGASVMQMGQSVYGLSQAMSAGIIKMQDFRQITDPMPGLMNKIADAFGMTVGQLRELVASGSLSSEEFGQKFVVALKTYEGAAARAAGTITATYADVENAKVEMAKELEKPIATGVLNTMGAIKSAYKFLSDNSEVIVNGLTAVAVVMASKVAGSVAVYTKSIVDAVVIEKAHTAAIIENEQRTVSAITTKVRAAEVKAAERKVTADLAQAELLAANATLELAIANELASGSAAMLVEAQIAQTAATAKATAATGSQAAADTFLGTQKARLTEATLALNAATAQSGVLMTRLGSAAKSAMAFVGGPVGVAVIALYALYEILNKVFDTEKNAEEAARKYSEALDAINESVKKLNQEQIQLETTKAQNDVEQLRAKIAKLEEFNTDNLLDFSKNADKRKVLKDDLKLVEEKLKALNTQDLELIKNFDATKLDKDQLGGALKETQANLRTLSDEAEALNTKLHEQGKLSFYEQKQLNDDNLRIAAFQAKESALQKQIELTSGATQEVINKKKRAAAKEATKSITDDLKEVTKEEDTEMQRRMELVQNNLMQRQAAIDLSSASASEKEQQITAAVKAAGDAQLLIIAHTGAEKLRITDETFAAELTKHKEGSFIYKSLEAEKLQHELEIYRSMEKSYSETVTHQIAEEVRLTQEAKRLADERKGIEQSYEDFKRQLHQIGLSDVQKKEEDITLLKKLNSDRQKAIKQGDYQQAEAIDKQILESGKQLALAERQKAEEARKTGKAYSDSTSEIVSMTDAAQKRIVSANQAAQDANKQRLDDTKLNAANAQEQLKGVQAEIANLTKELTAKGFMLTMKADTKAVDAAIARISQPTESTHTVHVKQDGGSNTKGYATGGYIQGTGTGTSDSNIAAVSNGEYIVKADSVNNVGVDALHYINANGQLPKFASGGLVGGLTPSFNPVVSQQASQKSGETFVLQIPLGNTTGTFTGIKTPENTDFLNQVAEAMKAQKRGMA